jgi:hypothetical protein
MEKVVWKGTFAEAEAKDDIYWAAQSAYERLAALYDIRDAIYDISNKRIEKVVNKRSLYEEDSSS